MWMSYCKDVEISDLESGVEYLLNVFQKLEFDAEHEANYGLGRYETPEKCEELAEQYRRGVEACELYLIEDICLDCFVQSLIEAKLQSFIPRIYNYLSDHIKDKLNGHPTDSETEEEGCSECK